MSQKILALLFILLLSLSFASCGDPEESSSSESASESVSESVSESESESENDEEIVRPPEEFGGVLS